MSIWGAVGGALTGIAATIATGNPAAGVAVGTTVSGAIGSASGSCPPRTGDAQFLLQYISAADRAEWLAFNPTTGGNAGLRWNAAIQKNDWNTLASYVVGEGDCKLAADEKLLVERFDALVRKYRTVTGLPPTPTVVSTTSQAAGSVGGAIQRIGQDVLDTAGAIASGAVSGAERTASAAARAASGTSSFGFDPMWLLAGGVVLLAFMLTRG